MRNLPRDARCFRVGLASLGQLGDGRIDRGWLHAWLDTRRHLWRIVGRGPIEDPGHGRRRGDPRLHARCRGTRGLGPRRDDVGLPPLNHARSGLSRRHAGGGLGRGNSRRRLRGRDSRSGLRRNGPRRRTGLRGTRGGLSGPRCRFDFRSDRRLNTLPRTRAVAPPRFVLGCGLRGSQGRQNTQMRPAKLEHDAYLRWEPFPLAVRSPLGRTCSRPNRSSIPLAGNPECKELFDRESLGTPAYLAGFIPTLPSAADFRQIPVFPDPCDDSGTCLTGPLA